MLRDMKTYTRYLIIAGIIVLAGLAVWRGVSRPPVASLSDTIATSSLSPIASASPLVISYDDAPKGWKTYSSVSMGFSVSYPSDWSAGVCGAQCVGWAPPTVASNQYMLGIIQSTGSIETLLKNVEQYLVAKEEIPIGKMTWLKLTLRQPQTGALITSHFITRGTELYEFGTASTDTDVIAAYGRMIASFEFLK